MNRRQRNRARDDAVACPWCGDSPWGYGRISNCNEHIARRRCQRKLAKLVLPDVNNNGTAVWNVDATHAIQATLVYGTDRRRQRIYATEFKRIKARKFTGKRMRLPPIWGTRNDNISLRIFRASIQEEVEEHAKTDVEDTTTGAVIINAEGFEPNLEEETESVDDVKSLGFGLEYAKPFFAPDEPTVCPTVWIGYD